MNGCVVCESFCDAGLQGDGEGNCLFMTYPCRSFL